jgi:hypothetical protein
MMAPTVGRAFVFFSAATFSRCCDGTSRRPPRSASRARVALASRSRWPAPHLARPVVAPSPGHADLVLSRARLAVAGLCAFTASVSLRGRGGFTVIAVAATCIASPALADGGAPKRPLAEAFAVEVGRCLEAESLVPAVARWLKQEAIDPRITIAVRRQGAAVVYGLYQDGVLVGQREVTSLPAGCSEFTAALALSIAVAIDATFFSAEEPGEPPTPASSPPPPPPRPPPQAPPPPKRFRSATPFRHRATLTGELGFLWNTLPGVRPLLGAGIDVAWSSYLETRTSILTATAAASPLGSGEVETQLYAARADVCAARPLERTKLRACLGLAWGFVESRGLGFVEPRSPSHPWLALPLRGEARFALGRDTTKPAWGLLTTVELIVTLRRPQIGVVGQTADLPSNDQRTAVLTLPPVGAAAASGLFFEF